MQRINRYGLAIASLLFAAALNFSLMPAAHANDIGNRYWTEIDTQGNEVVMAIPGSTIFMNPKTAEIVDVTPPSAAVALSITVSRGCTDRNAGCWTGGTALGDLQFAGTGAVSGNWPYRNQYQTGNHNGFVVYSYKGATHSSPRMGPWLGISMIDGASVTGLSVTRW